MLAVNHQAGIADAPHITSWPQLNMYNTILETSIWKRPMLKIQFKTNDGSFDLETIPINPEFVQIQKV